MKRRDFISVAGKTAPIAVAMSSYSSLFAAQNGRHLVDTAEKRELYLKKNLRKLCSEIGIHRVGTPEYDKAALIIREEMRLSMPIVELDSFTFARCDFADDPEFYIGDVRLETYAQLGCASTPPNGSTGILKKDVDGFAYGVVDPQTGELKAHVGISRFGKAICASAYRTDREIRYVDPARPMPPRFNIGRQDVHFLEDAVKNRTPIYVYVQTHFRADTISSSIVGTLPGESKEEILFLAHADSPPNSPGANDNTATVLVMIMLAHALSGMKLKRTFTIVATGGEEYGKLGAIHYANRRKEEGTLKNIKFITNMDSLTYGPNLQIYSQDQELKSLIMSIDRDLNIPGTPELIDQDGYWLDALPFRESGARALSVNSRGYNERTLHLWHRPEDTPEKVPLDCAEIGFLVFQEYIKRLQTL